MKRIFVKSVIEIALLLSLISVTYACDPLVIDIQYSYYYLKTYEVQEVNVFVTSGTVEEWDVTGDGDFSFWVTESNGTHLKVAICAGAVDNYELQVEAYSSLNGYASDTCTIRAADIYIYCDSFIAYAAGMDLGYELIPPISVPLGSLYVRDTSEDPADSQYFYTHGVSLVSSYTGTYHWNGKNNAGSYLPKGDYIVGFTSSFRIRSESPLRIVEVDSVSDVDYDTGRQYVPISNEDFYMYADDFYHPIYDHELWLYADSDPLNILGNPCFPSGSPVWSCTMTPTDPPISSRNGYYSILVNNFLGNQTGNFTVTAKASINDPVGASIDLTSFTATVAPEHEYIGYKTGTDITFNISPGTGWSYYSTEICIINESCDYIYKCEVPGFTGALGWDGKGNQGSYYNQFLLPDKYWIGIEIVPFYGSEKYLYYTSYYNPNLTVIKTEISATDLFGTVSDTTEDTVGAFVHYNIDNDDSSDNSVESPKHPGADYANDAVAGENDLKAFTMSLTPYIQDGWAILSNNSSGKIWKNATKGSGNLVHDSGSKWWNLDDVDDRNEFYGLCSSTLYVEGAGDTVGNIELSYMDPDSQGVQADTIKYTFIAADCGNQPTTTGSQRSTLETAFPVLVRCEWSITGIATTNYNCIAFSVDDTIHRWHKISTVPGTNILGIDDEYGNPKDGVFNMNDLDNFYLNTKGYTNTASGESDAVVMYYSNYHAAKRKTGCTCGSGKWIMYESKCGDLEKIEHVWNQLNGTTYGSPTRFYK